MAFTIPNVPAFKQQMDRDFPFSTQGIAATAVAVVNSSGQVASISPDELGRGYTGVPKVTIVDAENGPGTGATVVAIYGAANGGQITGYTVTAGGSGYVNPQAVVTGGGIDDTNLNYVRDTDISRALTAAGVNFNQALWGTQDAFNYAFILKAAHFLCVNLRASTQGLRGRGGEWLRNAFAVGDINASFDFPEKIKRSAQLAPLMETTYGSQYLQLVAPQLVANVFAACGWTKP